MAQINEWLLQELALPYRVVDKCHGDAGYLASHRQRDMEVWMSGTGEFMEVMTDTNATDYQARRLNIRYKGASGRGFCHLVNDTGCAMGRLLIAILDNYQQPDGAVQVPEALQRGRAEKRPRTEGRMMGERLDGRAIATQVQEELQADIAHLKQEHKLVPGLAVVLVGDDPASLSYVRAKGRACKDLGIHSEQIDLPANATTEDVLATVEQLNNDDAIHGILIQLPLPGQDEQQVLNAIDPNKDVDGLHPVNLGRLVRQEECFWPCTPHGVLQILSRSGIEVEGQHVVVVGRSTLVGRPVAILMGHKAAGANATVTLCHTGTRDLGHFTRQADILVVAAGFPRGITADMVKEGAVVIDVGINQVDDSSRERGWRLVGDVDYKQVRPKARAITPVPNGVGPMTIALLLYNTVRAAKRQVGLAG